METIAQIGISLLGPSAIFLVSRKNRWGFVFGMAAQPFWIVTALHNHQWGILMITVIYTYSWGYGIYKNFFKK